MQQAMWTPVDVTTERARAGANRRALGASASMSPSDRDLVARLLAGEETAFIGLVNRYHGSLVRLARAFVDSRDTAEDVAQETWLAVLNGLESFEGRGTLKGWIFRILVNRAKTRAQRDKRWVPLSDGAGDPGGEPAVDHRRFSAGGSWVQPPEGWAETAPEGLLLRRETLRAIERALADLPPIQRAIVTLRDIEGVSAEDVCNALQVSDVHQRVLLHRGRSKLRSAVEKDLASISAPSRPTEARSHGAGRQVT